MTTAPVLSSTEEQMAELDRLDSLAAAAIDDAASFGDDSCYAPALGLTNVEQAFAVEATPKKLRSLIATIRQQRADDASTTGNKYRAELYDEVWEKARSMGYGNVTMALAELERRQAAERAELERLLAVPVGVPDALRNEAEHCSAVMRYIGAMYAEEIDGDNVDIRFETEDGRDTGCDVSIVAYAERVADLLDAMRSATPAAPEGITMERIERHAQAAGGCPSSAKVVLLSSIKRMLSASPAAPAPAAQEPVDEECVHEFVPFLSHCTRCGESYTAPPAAEQPAYSCPRCGSSVQSPAPYSMQVHCAECGKASAATAAKTASEQPVVSRECRVISFVPGMGEVTFRVDGGVPAFMDVGETIHVSPAAEQPDTPPDLRDLAKRYFAALDRFDREGPVSLTVAAAKEAEVLEQELRALLAGGAA